MKLTNGFKKWFYTSDDQGASSIKVLGTLGILTVVVIVLGCFV